ncbi:MAG: hypothetical protein C0505_10030 [Leptothrix sp. (in: Bacteria)]|nr:hypothetical protein [Leptothrix sp. (in: b-proteobacteria)]
MTTQATLNLIPGPQDPQGPGADALDATGFEIGWDHARHGLVPPPELLLDGTPIGQGWRAARAVFGRRTLPAQQATRQWLALRTLAWREGIAFEGQQVTPHYLAQLRVARCPVLRTPLGGAPGQDDAAVIERLNPLAAYAAGNLVMMSRRAAQARAGVDLLETLRRARRAERAGEDAEGLDAGAWWRLATLRACATPLAFHEAARLPLAVLPPNRVRLLNPAQGLQALVTLLFTAPGWSARARALAALLPEHTLRHDFNLFIGALAPRILEAGADATDQRRALENAWLLERVQRRWQHFVLSLGETATAALLERATADGLAAVRTVSHPLAQATDGWALAEGGRAPRRQYGHDVLARRFRTTPDPARPDGGRARSQPA